MKIKINFLSPRAATLLLGLGIMFPLLVNIIWLRVNRTPPQFDDSAFLAHALTLYDVFCERGLPGFYSQYLRTLSWKGPIVAVQAVPIFMLFGRSIRIAPMINTLYLIVFSIYLYAFCRLYWNRTVASLAVLFSNLCPLLYGLANWYLRDYSYAMLMAMTAWHLVKSDGLRNMRQNIILGVILGIGVLHRDIYPLYAFPLYLVIVLPRLRRLGPSPQMGAEWVRFLVDCAVVLGLAFAIAFHWYWVNFSQIYAHSFGAAFGEDAKNYGSTDIFNWSAVIKPYLEICMIHGISTWLLILMGLGLAGTVVALARRRVRWGELFPAMGTALIVAWFLPFFVFLFNTNKDFRFTSPLLPAFGILLAILVWGAMRAARWAELAFGLAILPSLWICVYSLFGVGAPEFVRNNQTINTYFVPKYYVYPADHKYWPIREMLRYIYNLDLSPKADRTTVMTLNNSRCFNNETLQMMATLEKLPFLVTGGGDTNLERLRNWMGSMDYIIRNEGGEDDAGSIANPGPKMFAELQQQGIFEPVDCPIGMPDGGKVRLWRRARSMGSAVVSREWCAKEGLAPREVKFDGVATLRGFSATFRNGCVTVQTAWAPETAFWRQYRFFMHVLGDDGKSVLYNGDHAPQLDKLESYRYMPGALVYDCKVMNLGTGPRRPTKVKLGLVKILDGNRVQIAQADLPLIEGNSAVLDDVTLAPAGVSPVPWPEVAKPATTSTVAANPATTSTVTTSTVAAGVPADSTRQTTQALALTQAPDAATPAMDRLATTNTLAYFEDCAYLNSVELKVEDRKITMISRWRPFEAFWATHKIFCHMYDEAGHSWNLDHVMTPGDANAVLAAGGRDYVDTYEINIQNPQGQFVRAVMGLCARKDEGRVLVKSDVLKTTDGYSALIVPIADKAGVLLKP